MNHLKQLLEKIIDNNSFISSTLSNIKNKEKLYNKVTIKPFLTNNKILFQFSYIYDKKTTHKNLNSEETIEEFLNLMNYFKQGIIFTTNNDYHIFKNKNGSEKIIKHNPTKKSILISEHNRKKKYIIEENIPCDFLIKLEVMDKNGKVFKNKYDKFRQINKYLEIISSSIDILKNKENINIIDFGSGKAYLTFALYWYFTHILKKNVKIAGLDLKEDVVNYCNLVAKDLGYTNLNFYKGEIKDFNLLSNVDIVVTLHACDTATDDAIVQAIKWNSKLIMLVPCCQHELLHKINNPIMIPMLKHGIIKEKLSSLITDSIRGLLLEMNGYSVEIFEFIDMEHTPKNIIIRATYNKNIEKISKALVEYTNFKNFWHFNSYLENELNKIKN